MQGHHAMSRSSHWQVGPTSYRSISMDEFSAGQITATIISPTDKKGILYHTGWMAVSSGYHVGMKIPWVGIFIESVAGVLLAWRSTRYGTPTNYGGILYNSSCSTKHGIGIARKIGTGSWWWDINHLAFVSGTWPGCHQYQWSWNNKASIFHLSLKQRCSI